MTFYAVSGFVIAEAAVCIYSSRPVPFILNRAVRIALPYWIALTIMIATTLAIGGAIDYIGRPLPAESFSNVNLIANYLYLWPVGMAPFEYRMPHDFLLVFWSIRYEIVFYLAILVAIVLAGGNLARLRVVLISGALLVLIATIYSRVGISGPWAGFNTVPWPFFCAGVLAFFACDGRSVPLMAGVVIAAAIGFAGVGYSAPNIGPIDTSIQLGTLLALLASAWFLANVTEFRHVSQDQYLGDLSYALYLTHIPVQLLAVASGYRGPFVTASAIFASILVAAGFNSLSAPFINAMRDRIRGVSLRRDTAPTSQGGAMRRESYADKLQPEALVLDRSGG